MNTSGRVGFFLVLLVWLAALGSGVAVVYARHEARKAFILLQSLTDARDELAIEWDRLLIEQSTWATHARIEQIAREQLNMRVPDPENIVIVRP